jgi:hypothetical protein
VDPDEAGDRAGWRGQVQPADGEGAAVGDREVPYGQARLVRCAASGCGAGAAERWSAEALRAGTSRGSARSARPMSRRTDCGVPGLRARVTGASDSNYAVGVAGAYLNAQSGTRPDPHADRRLLAPWPSVGNPTVPYTAPRAGTPPAAGSSTRNATTPSARWQSTRAACGYQGRLALVQWVSVSRSSIWLTCRGGVANVA